MVCGSPLTGRPHSGDKPWRMRLPRSAHHAATILIGGFIGGFIGVVRLFPLFPLGAYSYAMVCALSMMVAEMNIETHR